MSTPKDHPVNIMAGGHNVNRLMAGLSDQQRDILGVVARLDRGKNGEYNPPDIHHELAQAGDRSASASISRAIIRLEARGLISRHHRHHEGKKHGWYFFVLTDAGLGIVNHLRACCGLPALDLVRYEPKPGMTDEEFMARGKAIAAESDLRRAKEAAGRLGPEGLEELRRWVDERLTSPPRGGDVNRLTG